MEPLERFQRAKRWAAVFSGLALLEILVGIIQSDTGGFLGVRIENTELLDDVLVALAFFFVFNAINMRTLIDDQYRTKMQYRIDDISVLIIFLAPASIYLFSILRPLTDRIGDALSFPYLEYLAMLAGILSAILVFLASTQSVYFLRRRSIEMERASSIKLMKLLSTESWMLIFARNNVIASRGKNGFKEIEFDIEISKQNLSSSHEKISADVFPIGAGRNRNEHWWRIKNGYLEILNDKMEIFSRFKKASDHGGFDATDDHDTKSIPGQAIVRDLNSWLESNS